VALVRGKFHTTPATVAVWRAVLGRVFFFELTHHAVDDVLVVVSHRRLPSQQRTDAEPTQYSANKK
jgi:hypothetical protein